MDYNETQQALTVRFFEDMTGKNTLNAAIKWFCIAAASWTHPQIQAQRWWPEGGQGNLPVAQIDFTALCDEVQVIILNGLMGYGEDPPVGIPATVRKAFAHMFNAYNDAEWS